MPRKQKKEKIVAKKVSPGKIMRRVANMLETCKDSVDEAVNQMEEGQLRDAIAAIIEAQRAFDGIGAGSFKDAIVGLKDAEGDLEALLQKVNG